VQLPAEEVPPELPEPALGINFARDGMQARAARVVAFFSRSVPSEIRASRSSSRRGPLTPSISPSISPDVTAQGLARARGGALGRVVDGGRVLLRREVRREGEVRARALIIHFAL
jgi:hypothetical protein